MTVRHATDKFIDGKKTSPHELKAPALLSKRNEALRRAVPLTRLADYGVAPHDALAIHEQTGAENPREWHEACEEIASRHAQAARQACAGGRLHAGADEWRQAAALYQAAQLAFNVDTPEKAMLYNQARHALRAYAPLAPVAHGVSVDELRLSSDQGELYGWLVAPPGGSVTAAVIIIGGLSGWGAAYLGMAMSLARSGMLCLLTEGPGQGSTRMVSGLHLSQGTFPLFRRFVDHAQLLGAQRIGVWGNSFGGLFAARLAVMDPRVKGVCINGAPMHPEVPGFQTAREQMGAVFGSNDEHDLQSHLASLWLDASRDRIDAPVLVVEGGQDPLVPLGEQHAFLALSPRQGTVMTWDDGEHTIYNHATDRNERICAWFHETLVGPSR
jgi:alpha-beta hydrolase superfamily lysophospholipase